MNWMNRHGQFTALSNLEIDKFSSVIYGEEFDNDEHTKKTYLQAF